MISIVIRNTSLHHDNLVSSSARRSGRCGGSSPAGAAARPGGDSPVDYRMVQYSNTLYNIV